MVDRNKGTWPQPLVILLGEIHLIVSIAPALPLLVQRPEQGLVTRTTSARKSHASKQKKMKKVLAGALSSMLPAVLLPPRPGCRLVPSGDDLGDERPLADDVVVKKASSSATRCR